ncbi:MAG: radical SAM protein [Nitrospirota bacterium]|nr:radical SAM protein [Nitrospirota bacterium]
MLPFTPYFISWNTTKRCNLKCSHCYLDAADLSGDTSNELTTDECYRLIDQMSEVAPGAMLIITGGEPLLRPDIYDICSYSSQKGFISVLGTNGTPVTDETAARLVECGVKGVGISLDSMDPKIHDDFRKIDGCWEGAVRGMEACRTHGLDFQVQTTVVESNYNQIKDLIDFSYRAGARAFNLFFLVCTGRGQDLTDITPEQYHATLDMLVDIQDNYPGMMVRARCAPHYTRNALDSPNKEGYVTGYNKPCTAGTNYCRISPEGDVTPCPYMPISAGNVRQRSFVDIWRNSPLFEEFRNPTLKGKCGSCEISHLCGGCRARAYAHTGDIMAEDPWCNHEPEGIAVPEPEKLRPLDTTEEFTLYWEDEARARLAEVPNFARGFVVKGVEGMAKAKGLDRVTAELMAEARAKRDEMMKSRFKGLFSMFTGKK